MWAPADLRKQFPTCFDMCLEMRRIHCIEHTGRNMIVTPFVGRQPLISEVFGIDVLKDLGPVYTSHEIKAPWQRTGALRTHVSPYSDFWYKR